MKRKPKWAWIKYYGNVHAREEQDHTAMINYYGPVNWRRFDRNRSNVRLGLPNDAGLYVCTGFCPTLILLKPEGYLAYNGD